MRCIKDCIESIKFHTILHGDVVVADTGYQDLSKVIKCTLSRKAEESLRKTETPIYLPFDGALVIQNNEVNNVISYNAKTLMGMLPNTSHFRSVLIILDRSSLLSLQSDRLCCCDIDICH